MQSVPHHLPYREMVSQTELICDRNPQHLAEQRNQQKAKLPSPNVSSAGSKLSTPTPVRLPIHARCLLCRDVLIDPVVLPCDTRHRLCGECFAEVREKSELCCPFCRKRLSNWIRRNRDTLVDQTLWKEVQEQYGKWVHARKMGLDLSDEEGDPVAPATHQIATAGEIHNEYQRFLAAAAAERTEQAALEMEASRVLLQELDKNGEAVAAER